MKMIRPAGRETGPRHPRSQSARASRRHGVAFAGAPGADLRSQTHADRHARGRHSALRTTGILRHRVVGRRASQRPARFARRSRRRRSASARTTPASPLSRASPTDTSSAAARTASSPCGLAYRTPPLHPSHPPPPRSSLRERRRPPGTRPRRPRRPRARARARRTHRGSRRHGITPRRAPPRRQAQVGARGGVPRPLRPRRRVPISRMRRRPRSRRRDSPAHQRPHDDAGAVDADVPVDVTSPSRWRSLHARCSCTALNLRRGTRVRLRAGSRPSGGRGGALRCLCADGKDRSRRDVSTGAFGWAADPPPWVPPWEPPSWGGEPADAAAAAAKSSDRRRWRDTTDAR